MNVPTPELDKRSAVMDDARVASDFYDFLRNKGIILARYYEDQDRLAPIYLSPEQLLAEWKGIDLAKIEAERMALLAALRAPKIGREFEIKLPYSRPPLTKNGIHRMHHQAIGRVKAQLKQDARVVIRHAKVPHLERVEVELVYYPGNNRRQDADGLAPTLSPCLDAAVAEGVLTDDSGSYVLESQQCIVLRRDDPFDLPMSRLVFIIRERTE